MDPNRCFECLAEIPAGSKCLTVCDACWGKVESSVASPLEPATGSEQPLSVDEMVLALKSCEQMAQRDWGDYSGVQTTLRWLRAALPGLLADRDHLARIRDKHGALWLDTSVLPSPEPT